MQDVIQDADGNRYFAVKGKGLFVLDTAGNLRCRFVEEFENASNEIFDLKNVRRFFLDNNGVVWCATDGDGAVLIDLRSEKFRPVEWLDDANTVNRFRSFSRCITEVDGNLWIASYREGITIFEKDTRQAKPILRGENRVLTVSAIEDCGSYVLIGSDAGLFRLNKPYERALLIPISEDVAVKAMVRMNNHFCIATNAGLYNYAPDTHEFLHWDVVQIMNTTSLLKDNSDRLLVGLNSEGIAVVSADGEVLRVQLRTADGHALPNLDVKSMIQVQNRYYAATNHGLFVLRQDFSQEAMLSEKEGLANGHLYGLLADENGMIWISTNGGISRFNPNKGKFKNFTTADGLQSMEYNRNSYYSSSEGVFYFGGTTGVSLFTPNKLRENYTLPFIRLAGIEIMNEATVNSDSLATLSLPLHCAYDKNNLQFEVAVLDFFRADQYDVEYKLEGWDRSFQSVGNDRFIRYTNLPPGTYKLIARIANEENASETMLLTIIIEAPLWLRAWFIASLVILFLVVMLIVNSIYIRARNRKAEAALERVREIEKMRSRISKDIHDEVGAGLTKIALMSEAAKVNQGSKEEVSATLDKLANTSRNITQGLHEIIWSVNPDADNSSSLFDHIKQYAYEFLEETDISLQVDIDDAVPLSLSPVMRRNVFLIVKEALNNSVKHANASRVEIILNTTLYNTWGVSISDNGIGFSSENSSAGHGLRNMKSRAEQCGLDLQLQSEVRKGTTIRLIGKSE
jgi:signal transduction histidine kinase